VLMVWPGPAVLHFLPLRELHTPTKLDYFMPFHFMKSWKVFRSSFVVGLLSIGLQKSMSSAVVVSSTHQVTRAVATRRYVNLYWQAFVSHDITYST
jgi:hypothetical protein